MRQISDFAMLSPMKYYNNEAESQKRSDMINNKDDMYMATVKKDGDWSMLIHYSKGNNLIRSRSISSVTGVYGDYTAKVPHICDEMDKLPDNTVLLAELCWDEPGTNANTVGTILRCLPAKAVERQKEHKLKALVFDCLMIDGIDMTNDAYVCRFQDASELLMQDVFPSEVMYMTQRVYPDEHHDNFLEWADEIIADGGEGLVIQRKDNPYMPGSRTAWKTLKLKQSLPEMELKVVGTLEPNRKYDGDFRETWDYWVSVDCNDKESMIDGFTARTQFDDHCKKIEPVTKPYWFGWKNGITVEHGDFTTDVASGLTDEDREWLATDEAQQLIRDGKVYAVVKAMSFNDKGRLRHGYLVRLRTDVLDAKIDFSK